MTDPETPTTPEVEEPKPDANAPEQEPGAAANGEGPKAPLDKGEPDWRQAFDATQKANSRIARRLEEQTATTAALVDAIKLIREGQTTIAKATLPPEQAEAFEAAAKGSEDAHRQKQIVEQATKLVTAQQAVQRSILSSVGLDKPAIDSVFAYANEAVSVEEYAERFHAASQAAIAKARDGLLRSVDSAVRTKTKEAETKLKDEQRRLNKEAGLDKIDISQGSASTFAQRLATMDPNSKEFADLTDQALAGRLRGV